MAYAENYTHIGVEDTDRAEAIMQEAYDRLAHRPPLNLRLLFKDRSPLAITKSPVSSFAADAVTLTALEQGIYASREIHDNHVITNFSSARTPPSPSDPVMCLTWGQHFDEFHGDTYEQIVEQRGDPDLPGYFGTREDVVSELGVSDEDYERFYAPESTMRRQHTYSRVKLGLRQVMWLATTPDDLLHPGVPVGQVSRSSFSDERWQPDW